MENQDNKERQIFKMQKDGFENISKGINKLADKEVQKVELKLPEANNVAAQFFQLLRGDKGEKGDKGDKGDTGEALTWDMLNDEQKALLKGELQMKCMTAFCVNTKRSKRNYLNKCRTILMQMISFISLQI